MRSPARAIFTALLGVTLACVANGCSANPVDETDEPQGSVSNQLVGCSMTRQQIMDSASAARREAVTRGFAWLDDNVPYSQSANHEGYRTDCSGFVSMCWDLGRSSNTSSFYSGDANSRLGGYDDLVVADALVKQGHIMLFLGWNDAAHSGACVLEQASTASDMQFRVRTTASLTSQGYKAIRAKTLASDLAPAPAPKPSDETIGDDDTDGFEDGPVAEPDPIDEPTQEPTEDPVDEAPPTTNKPSKASSSVSTQSEEVGDEGDPDEDTDTDEDGRSTKKTTKKRTSSADSLASGGCSTTSGRPSSPMSWLPLVGVVFALGRRRRR